MTREEGREAERNRGGVCRYLNSKKKPKFPFVEWLIFCIVLFFFFLMSTSMKCNDIENKKRERERQL